MKLQMKNNAGVLKTVPTGMSWTGFFFTYFTMWARGMVGLGFLWLFILSWIQGIWLFSVLSMGFIEAMDGGDGSVTGGLSTFFALATLGFSFLFLFKLNRWTARHWLNRGFVPQGQGWSVWGPKYGIEVTEEMKAADSNLAQEKKVKGKDIFGFIVVAILLLSLLSGGGNGSTSAGTTDYDESNDDVTQSASSVPQTKNNKSIKGLWVGMPLEEAKQVCETLLEGSGCSVGEVESGGLAIYDIGSRDGSYFGITALGMKLAGGGVTADADGKVNGILFSGGIVEHIFNASDMEDSDFVEKFADSYGIPEFDVSDDFTYWHSDLAGVRFKIEDGKGLTIKKISQRSFD